jgi:hypothetical protein
MPKVSDWVLEVGGIPCGVYLGPDGTQGPTEISDEHGRRATATFQCEWASRNDLIGALVGTVDYPGAAIARTPPFSYPFATVDTTQHTVNGSSNSIIPQRLVCTAISRVQGTKWRTDNEGGLFSEVAGWGGFAYALITAEFTCPNYMLAPTEFAPAFTDLSTLPYVITKTRVSAEILAPPAGAFQYADGAYKGKPLLDVGAAQPRSRLEINMTRVRMPIVPTVIATPLLGSVNQDPFVLGGLEFTKGAVLFNGMNPEPRSDPYNGGIVWDVEYQFLANGLVYITSVDDRQYADWNWFLDPKGEWTKVTYPDGKTPVFEYADFRPLFQDAIS